jgi:hypothetical protein
MNRSVNAVIVFVVASVLASCSSSGGGSNGTLAFGQQSYTVTSGSTRALLLTLSGSTSTSGVTVTIASSSPAVAVPIFTPCVLSDEAGSTSSCTIQVKALANGSTTVTASGPGVASASTTVSVSATPVPGTLAFVPASENVVAGSVQQVTLGLADSSGMPGQVVAVTSSNAAAATASPSQCVLSTEAPTCDVTVAGVAAGSASIVASTGGYANATNAATVKASGSVAGTLSFGGNLHLAVGGSANETLSLVGSSNVAPFTVTLSPQNTLATVSPTTCTLSTASPVCHLTISGNAAGSDRISASATGYDGVSMIAYLSASPVPGNQYFSQTSETVSVGATTTIELLYSGGSGVPSLPVTLATNNANATISPTTCNMNNTSGGSDCTITVTGASVGATTITASTPGYPDAQNTVTVQPSGHVVYGTLAFSPANVSLAVGGRAQLTLQLRGSTNVSGLSVGLAALPTGVVSLGQVTCVLSTTNNSCNVTVIGAAIGSTTISTTSVGPTTQALAAVTVSVAPPPALVFTPDPLVLIQSQIGASTVTLSMANPPTTPVQINLPTSTAILGVSVIPDPCVLSAARPTCAIAINNASTANPLGQYAFTATPLDSTIPAVTLPVYISQLGPVSRTLKVQNKCSYTVWAGMSGGAVASVNPIANPGQAAPCPTGTSYANGYCCPTGSASVAGDYCFWNNPVPDNGYALTTGQATHFTIPSTSLTTAPGLTHVWSGGIMARLGCDPNGNCAIGSCNDGATGSLACAVGVGFDAPQTVAEFTLLQGGPDAYDVQLIAGVTVPTSMGPTTLSPDQANPYISGLAGSTTTQIGSQYTLNAASWTFTPPAIGSPASSTYLTLVSGTATASDTCTSNAGCSAGKVCGYALNSIKNLPSFTPPGPTYARTCGAFLAYLTADAIWKGNPDTSSAQTNAAPISFYTVFDVGTQSTSLPYPNVNQYPLYQFVDCPNPPLDSGFQAATTYPIACGCTDWAGIATPTSTCQGTGQTTYTSTTPGIGFNSAWLDQVLPLLGWLKQGCPTCYSYQFDDASSSFQAYAAANPNNGSNATNYTITFCP